MILAGLWYSRDKPEMRTLLQPLIEDFNELYTHGMCLLICMHPILKIPLYTYNSEFLYGMHVAFESGCDLD